MCFAANLFNTATDRIVNNTTQAMTFVVNYDDSVQLIIYLDYAEDVIFADAFDMLEDVLLTFNEQSPNHWGYMSNDRISSFNPSAHRGLRRSEMTMDDTS